MAISLLKYNIKLNFFLKVIFAKALYKIKSEAIMKGFTGFFTLILCFILSCRETTTVEEVTYPEVTYTASTFVDVDYIFENEGLNRPMMVRIIPNTNELVVLDEGNVCLYVFSQDGTHLQIIGRRGQGPGEFIGPRLRDWKSTMFIEVDESGDIYVFDGRSTRISIFSKEGKLYNTFRLEKGVKMSGTPSGLSITKNREIVMNLPSRGYYITVYSRDGEMLREIGEITKYGFSGKDVEGTTFDEAHFDELYAQGYPFVDDNGNYYIFLNRDPLVKKYNENGDLVYEQQLEIPEIKTILENWEPPEDRSESYIWFVSFFNQVVHKNNQFYILNMGKPEPDDTEISMFVYVLDMDLKIKKKILLNGLNLGAPDSNSNREGLRFALNMTFDINIDEEIFIPISVRAEILKLQPEK